MITINQPIKYSVVVALKLRQLPPLLMLVGVCLCIRVCVCVGVQMEQENQQLKMTNLKQAEQVTVLRDKVQGEHPRHPQLTSLAQSVVSVSICTPRKKYCIMSIKTSINQYRDCRHHLTLTLTKIVRRSYILAHIKAWLSKH